MNKYLLGLMFVFWAFSVHSETAINNDSSRSIGSESSQTLDRQKEITINNANKEISSQVKGQLRSLDLSEQQFKQFAVSEEVSLDSILIPLIRDFEYEVNETDWNDPNKTKSNFHHAIMTCRRFSSVPNVATSYPFTRPTRVLAIDGQPIIENGTNYSFVENKALTYENLSFQGGSMEWASSVVKRPVSTPMLPATCVYLYANIGKEVMDRLAYQKIGGKQDSPLREKMFFAGSVRDEVSRALSLTILRASLDNPVYQAVEAAKKEINRGCRLPTLYGIQNSITDWQCGGLMVDSDALSATLGGVKLIGDNYYHGKSVTLTSVNGFALSEAVLVSENESLAVSSESEKTKETTLRKGQSTSTKIGTSVDSGSGSGVGSSGQ